VKQVKRNSVFAGGSGSAQASDALQPRQSSFVVHEGEVGGEKKTKKKSMTHAEIALHHGSDEYSHKTFEAPDVKQVKRNSVFGSKGATANPVSGQSQ
jgi:hypothetical protein